VPGHSDDPSAVSSASPASRSALADKERGKRWERFAEVDNYQVIAPAAGSRGHHVGVLKGEVRANDIAAASSGENRGPMGKGAVWVELHRDRSTGGSSGLFAMEKREAGYNAEGGDWEYVVVDDSGRVQSRGELAACARCHADAPIDFVFLGPKKR
jgi:hypothetical protein